MLDFDGISEIAIQMILLAGNAREALDNAVKAFVAENREDCARFIEKAGKEISEAHRKQTAVIQSTVEQKNYSPTLLFSHAMDTVMTVYSEIQNTTRMIDIFTSMFKREEKSAVL
jgi:PTS system cellobiose-specific IIA component